MLRSVHPPLVPAPIPASPRLPLTTHPSLSQPLPSTHSSTCLQMKSLPHLFKDKALPYPYPSKVGQRRAWRGPRLGDPAPTPPMVSPAGAPHLPSAVLLTTKSNSLESPSQCRHTSSFSLVPPQANETTFIKRISRYSKRRKELGKVSKYPSNSS